MSADGPANRQQNNDFKAVLTMPNMDGITAMRQIHAIKPDARVILASGFSKDDLDERIADHPPAGLICKPYRLSVLEVEIRRVCGCRPVGGPG